MPRDPRRVAGAVSGEQEVNRAVMRRRVTGASGRKRVSAPEASEPRRSLVAFCREMAETALSPGRSGNMSIRLPGGMLITPTGMPYRTIAAADIVEVLADGSVPAGQRAPSSEWQMHLDIYASRADAEAIVHTHSLNATALSCLRRDIPAFHYMVAAFGGDRVVCAPYATYGTEALARHALKALGRRQACLLANHGAIVLGRDIAQAFERAQELEALAAQYLIALQAGRPHILGSRDMKQVLEKFRSYGLQTEPGEDA
jgi:L-fuculose-phosphate aldolase